MPQQYTLEDALFAGEAVDSPAAQQEYTIKDALFVETEVPEQRQPSIIDALFAGEVYVPPISDKRKKELQLLTPGLTNKWTGFRQVFADRTLQRITDPIERDYIIESVRERSRLKDLLRRHEEQKYGFPGKAAAVAAETVGGIAEGAAGTAGAFVGPNRILPGVRTPGLDLPIVGRLPILGGMTLGPQGGGLGGRKYTKEDQDFLRRLEEAKLSENPYVPKDAGLLRVGASGAGALASDIAGGGLAGLAGGAPGLMTYAAMRYGAGATEKAQDLGLGPYEAAAAGAVTAIGVGGIEALGAVDPLGLKKKALSPLAEAGKKALIEYLQKRAPKTTVKTAELFAKAPKTKKTIREFAEYLYRGALEVGEEGGQAAWDESVKQAASLLSDNVDPRDPWNIGKEAISAVQESAVPVFIAGGVGPAFSAISKEHFSVEDRKKKVRELTEKGAVSRKDARLLRMPVKDRSGKKYTPDERFEIIREEAHDDAMGDRSAALRSDGEITDEDAKNMELPPEAGETTESRRAFLRMDESEAREIMEGQKAPQAPQVQSELDPFQSTQIDTGAPQRPVQQPRVPEVTLEQQAAPEAPVDITRLPGHELSKAEYEDKVSKIEKLPGDSFRISGTIVEQNPTDNELRDMIREVRKEFPKMPKGDVTVRTTRDERGNQWVWKAHDGTHAQIEPGLSRKIGVDVDQNKDIPRHSDLIREAIREGKSVPKRVQDEYPQYAEFFSQAPAALEPLTAAPELPSTQDLSRTAGNEWLEREGLSPVKNPGVRPFAEAVGDAVTQNLAPRAVEHARGTLALVDAGRQPEMNSDTQHSAYKIRSKEISKELTDIRERRLALPTDAEAQGLDEVALQERYNRIDVKENTLMDEMNDLVTASQYSGTTIARALSIMQDREAQENFDYAGYLQQLQKANKALPVSKREQKAAADDVGEYKDLELAVQREFQDDQIKRDDATRKEAERVVAAAKKRGKGSKRPKKEEIQAKRADLIEQLRQRGVEARSVTGFLSEESGAADIETLRLIGKIGLTYAEEGIGEISVITEKLKHIFPGLELTDVEAWESLIMQNPRQKAKDKTEAQRREKYVKTIAGRLIKIEKAYRGFIEEAKERPPTDKKIRALQKEYILLRNALLKSGLDTVKMERVLSKIVVIQNILDTGRRQIKSEPDVIPPELARLQEQARDLQSQINIRDELIDIKRQFDTGEFRTRPRVVKRKVSKKLEVAQIELAKQRAKMRQIVRDREPDIRFRKWRAVTAEMKAMAATADFSFAFRQNMWQMFAHPIRNFKPFFKSFAHILTENSAQRLSNALRNDANADIREMSGLKIMDPSSVGDQNKSELFRGQWIENLKWKVPYAPMKKWQTPLGYVMSVSSRHAVAIGNLVRATAFDAFMDLNPNATQTELKAIADYINKSTGLGDMSFAGPMIPFLNEILFSPKFVMSRFQTPLAAAKYWNLPRVRNQIGADLVRMTATAALIGFLAKLSGFEVEWEDPESPDWLKIRFGDTREDIGGGFLQPLRLVARIGVAAKKLATGRRDEINMDVLELLGRFSKYKLAPAYTTLLELFHGKTAVGEEVTPVETLVRAPIPLIGREFYDAIDYGWAAVLGTIAAIPGFGVATYRDSFSAAERRMKNFHERGEHAKERSVRSEHNRGVRGKERKLRDLHRSR